ncbi:glycerol uptake facilitator protein [Isoptericola sp. CG 20/1183]|uniref:Glycerol uptake facilitator protein n=1 Tax=Isoptericola halotolerans TaxID=300560 RepID=A0ABX5EIY7_9MICO|nr:MULTISPECIES: MIP/aquaporin family protein [Isoptericola]MCK0117224.1 aquaporin family protein [Isoptericola sp. S6320L]PRZ09646.1 glycerol uptake facilitator protein [Isoptericola sp. CG 20/1183]PRZ10447.1 glycerol uptake facilitator protein [Isoptericola halotolerans]
MSSGELFITEFLGTMILLLGGAGVVANVILPKTKGFNGGWLLINFGWGLAVFAGVFVAFSSGAHINPAVTFGIWASGASEFGPGIPVNAANGFIYISAQMAGAAVGSAVAFLAYKKHFDEEAPPATKLAVFSTGPEIRSYGWNFVTEVVGTFFLVFLVLSFGNWPGDMGPLAVALIVVGIGASLGGPTGYAINPARDLGPRIAHALLPIKGKGSSDWGYSWVPVLGPIVGGVLGGLLAPAVAFG